MLDAASTPVAQIVLIDAPAVLGWERGASRVEVRDGTDGGSARRRDRGRRRSSREPLRPLPMPLLGAMDEAVLYVARAKDQTAAREEMAVVLGGLLAGLRATRD